VFFRYIFYQLDRVMGKLSIASSKLKGCLSVVLIGVKHSGVPHDSGCLPRASMTRSRVWVRF
jgi:hypothetical protein